MQRIGKVTGLVLGDFVSPPYLSAQRVACLKRVSTLTAKLLIHFTHVLARETVLSLANLPRHAAKTLRALHSESEDRTTATGFVNLLRAYPTIEQLSPPAFLTSIRQTSK